MNTAIANPETLVQLAAEHPEKLDAINEFLRSIIMLVDLGKNEPGKPAEPVKPPDLSTIKWDNPWDVKIDPKPSCMVIKTNKYKTLKGEYTYHVHIRDGEHEVSFLDNSEKHLDLKNCTGGTNAHNIYFFMGPSGEISKSGRWEKGQSRNWERNDMIEYINKVLSMDIPIMYAEHEGTMVYTY